MNSILRAILTWLSTHATFRLYSSGIPVGKLFGGHDLQGVTDAYIVLVITIGPVVIFNGCWQTA
jgi:hypothetical protein